MLTALLLAATLGQTDYDLVSTHPIRDYAFAPLRSEHLVDLVIRPAKKRTEPTPAKCPGGVCVAKPKPQAIEPKSVLIKRDEECTDCQPNKSLTRRTSWRFFQRFR